MSCVKTFCSLDEEPLDHRRHSPLTLRSEWKAGKLLLRVYATLLVAHTNAGNLTNLHNFNTSQLISNRKKQ